MNLDVLKEIGLTDGQIKVYLALLKLGSTTTGPVIDESGIAKSIVYNILEKLIEKGLVSYVLKNGIKHYTAESPSRILDYLKKRTAQLEAKTKDVEDLIPLLTQMQKPEKKIEVQVYEGFKGVQTCYEHHIARLKRGDELLALGILAHQEPRYHQYWMRYHMKRIKLGFKNRMLFNTDTPREVLVNRNSYKDCDSRYMVRDLKTPSWVMIYKDTAAIFLQNKDLVVEIVNQEIADTFRAYFEDYWRDTKPFK
ncbi:hypothetical protein HQ545_00010 [Candidatus Woesearchaeota archaeon]|nr:hypothetical protein [Candidatus Woesearchaeota archaeon]